MLSAGSLRVLSDGKPEHAMEYSAKELRVVVTAGAAGIGRAIARTFVEHGAKVHICDVDEKALAALGKEMPQVTRTRADVSSVEDVERLFQEAKHHLGGLDVLVNNAGIAGPTAKVEDIRPQDWERCIAVDLNGMFYCTRKAMPLIKAAGGGSIINLSSIAGRLGFAMRTPYSAAKWAVVGFTQSLAVEAGPDHVRVNCIQPGIVEGERVDRIVAAKAEQMGVSNEEILNRMVEGVALKTTVSAQDVANTALFLASQAGRHISGQAISVCGGVRYLV
jgi:NAD(P)-dependent dehydrogenase (short-subunit alcohol dehydrogenase family)